MKYWIYKDRIKDIVKDIGQENLDKAIEALRSGKYEQTTNKMTDRDNPTPNACCLGVIACEVDGKTLENIADLQYPTIDIGISNYLRWVRVWVGEGKTHTHLADMNDNLVPHPVIADVLEGKVVNYGH